MQRFREHKAFVAVFFAVWISTTWVGMNSAVALPNFACTVPFRELLRKAHDSFDGRLAIGLDRKHALATIWPRGEAPTVDKLERSFQLYLDARLEGMPIDVAQKVRAIVASRLINQPTDKGSEYEYNPHTENLHLRENSKEFPEQLILYSILAHETEHVIQHQLARHQDLEQAYLDTSNPKHPQAVRALFLAEKSAMLAEWSFLNLLPNITGNEGLVQQAIRTRAQELKVDALQYVLRSFNGKLDDPLMDPLKREFLIRIAMTWSGDSRDYLRKQWRGENLGLGIHFSPRYSMADVQQAVNLYVQSANRERARYIGGCLLSGSLIVGGISHGALCLYHTNVEKVDSAFARTFCLEGKAKPATPAAE